ncbi:recombinase family protein [Bradyrhizobium sp. 190]|uniref:recombinase family protein n=1 Tax=Bradyrhizobium sp. 190 TaxID=2782658 RepID=UPI001FF8B654|nr:recombinase family protein [Bradyrhizobium sp. 190]MCK1514097.1 recombinase family protein [Bradyrhizobium sp. 190]
MDVIVYYRTRPSDPSYSDQALEEQRAAVHSWLTSRPAIIKAEYIEPETDGFSRPHLRDAIEACKQTGATLLVGRTEAVGSGAPFSPRITSVPVAFAPNTPRDKGYIIPVPEKAPGGLTLYFPDHSDWRIMPVYLCNRTDQAMRDIEVGTVGVTAKLSMSTPIAAGSAPLATTPTSLTIEQLAPNTAVLIDRHDPMIDGDFITFYDVAFIDQRDQKQLIRTAIGPGGPFAKFVAVVA